MGTRILVGKGGLFLTGLLAYVLAGVAGSVIAFLAFSSGCVFRGGEE